MPQDLRDQLQSTLGAGYSVERELGGGGMSRVFVAHDGTLGRRVVVKVLPPELAAGVNLGRFRREIQLAAQLQHPHIVPVLSAGETEGLPFFTMPLIEGETLRDRLARSGEMSIPDTVKLLRDIAKALAYAHRSGVVHRDIKPENILISDDSALVSDFGVAKALSASAGSDGLTSLGIALGTPAYMAPEQAAADPTADHRADIYSFGVVGYELLTAHSPFHGRAPQQMIAAHMTEKPASVDTIRPSTPPVLASLIGRCLEKHPGDRPQSASELLHELDGLTTPLAGTKAAMPPAREAGKGSTARALAIFAAAFLVVVGGARLAVMRLDVPDWVFPGAILVMALGIPMIVLTAMRDRLATSSGVFTWRRTMQGGVVATGTFVLLVVGYVMLRSLGIGPAGSLAAAGVLRDREPVLIADFDSPPEDSVLGSVVAEAFRTDLSQSPNLSVVAPATVRQVLTRMQRVDASRLDLALAREIATREGVKIVIDGDVAGVGDSYVLTARLVSADSGTVLAAFRETAADPEALIPAINRLTRKVRAKVGESLRNVRETPSLEQVTTPSLAALRKYAQGVRALEYDSDFPRGEALLEEALVLDSGFAMAWRKLGVSIGNQRGSETRRVQALSKAFEYRDRLTERERYLTMGSYYSGASWDPPKAMTAWKSLLELEPGNSIAHNNIAISYQEDRDWAKAVEHLRRTAALEPRPNAFNNLALTLVSMDSVDAARATLDSAEKLFPNNVNVAGMRWTLAVGTLNYDSADVFTERFAALRRSDPFVRSIAARGRAVSARVHGRLADGDRHYRESFEAERQLGRSSAPLDAELEEAWTDAWFRDDDGRALAKLERALAVHPLDSMPPLDRPYLMVARLFVEVGDPARALGVLADMEAALPAPELARRANSRHAVRGHIALAEGRATDAITEFRAADRGPCLACALPTLARAYDISGSADSAIAVYERYLSTHDPERYNPDESYLAGSYKRLGELYERRGDRSKAIGAYERFLHLWGSADPALQPLVADVRQRVVRLRRAE